MFGAFGGALAETSVSFVSGAAQDAGLRDTLGLAKQTIAVENTRNIGKKDLILNDAMPTVEVNPETYEVRARAIGLPNGGFVERERYLVHSR